VSGASCQGISSVAYNYLYQFGVGSDYKEPNGVLQWPPKPPNYIDTNATGFRRFPINGNDLTEVLGSNFSGRHTWAGIPANLPYPIGLPFRDRLVYY